MATVNAGFHQLAAPQLVMLANAALFVVQAILDLGIPLGPLSEPRVAAASVTQTVCAIALAAGGLDPLYLRHGVTVAGVIGNVVALAGIALGVIALALGAGPRTLTNDISYALMTALAFLALWLLLSERRSRRRR
jgi:hypothetical protein